MLKNLYPARFFSILWQTMKRFDGSKRYSDASAMTYTTLFAIVPVLTVVFSILSAVPAMHDWGGDLNAKILSYVMPEGSEQISEYLLAFSQQAKRLTWVGVLFLFITAISLLYSIEIKFNKIWNVEKSRSGLQTFFRYWVVLSLGPVLIVGGIATSSYIVSLPKVTGLEQIPFGLRLVPWMFSTVALTAIYMFVPNCRVPWRNALVAGVLVAALFEVGKFLFANIMSLFPSYKLIYGAFAAVPLFLLWIYIAWLLLFFGAEFSYALSHYTPKDSRLPALWRRLFLVQKLIEIQKLGLLKSEAEIVQMLPDLSAVQVRLGLFQLQKMGFATLTQDNQWVWIGNADVLPMAELLQDLTQIDLQAELPNDIKAPLEIYQKWLAWQQSWKEHNQEFMGKPLGSML
ncbi:MAG: YihY family inner membrane protein [Venatoribacter sp.]